MGQQPRTWLLFVLYRDQQGKYRTWSEFLWLESITAPLCCHQTIQRQFTRKTKLLLCCCTRGFSKQKMPSKRKMALCRCSTKPPSLLSLEWSVSFHRCYYDNNRTFGCHTTAVCAVKNSAHLIVEFWRHLKTVHIYFGLCVSRSQLTSFLGPYWIFLLSSQWLHTCYGCEYFLYIAWLRNPRASAWYLVVFTFTECI